jgi:hypothetical protein
LVEKRFLSDKIKSKDGEISGLEGSIRALKKKYNEEIAYVKEKFLIET